MQPMIPALCHVHCIARALHNKLRLDNAGNFTSCISIDLQRHNPPAAQAFIRSDHKAAVAISDTTRQRLRAEPTKHDRVHRANSRASEHRIGRL